MAGLWNPWGSRQLLAGQAICGFGCHWGKILVVVGVWWGHGTRLSVCAGEILANCSAAQEGKVEPRPNTLQRGTGIADLNWVYSSVVEGILQRTTQSHQQELRGGGGRARGLLAGLSHHWGRGRRGCQITLQCPEWGRDPSRASQGSGCCRAVLVDTPLQSCLDIGDCAFGVADGCGCPPLQEGGLEAVFQYRTCCRNYVSLLV